MSFVDTQQVNRTAIAYLCAKLAKNLSPTINSASPRGIRNDVSNASVDTDLAQLATAIRLAGYGDTLTLDFLNEYYAVQEG